MTAPTSTGYLALARNRSFSLLWLGQLISFFGDRLHQVAVAVLVLGVTGSPLAVALTFAASFVPTVIFGPLVGVFVDRWPHRRTMIIADLARAALVPLAPAALWLHPLAIYLLVASVASISVFFRPAKTAVLPLIVNERELVRGNAAHTMAETAADLLGYPAAGVLVALAAEQLWIIFVLDSLSYLLSAACVAGMSIPAVERLSGPLRLGQLGRDLAVGWRTLWGHAELAANTVISVVAQVAIGAHIGLALVYAERHLAQDVLPYPENYSILMAAIGLGSLVGGVLVTVVADHLRKGLLISGSFIGFGALLAGLALIHDPFVAIAAFALIGVLNMGFLVPNMALFQERVAVSLMGRVVAIRGALVVGAMSAGMALAGLGAELTDTGTVFAAAGGLTALAASVGLLLPAMRNAR